MTNYTADTDPILISRIVLLGLITLLLTAADTSSASFCERLAPQLGMHLTTATSASRPSPREWKVSMLTGTQRWLTGGTGSAALSVSAINQATGEEYARPDRACNFSDKGAICNIKGPARLSIRTRRGETTLDASASERATVEVRKTNIYCRDS